MPLFTHHWGKKARCCCGLPTAMSSPRAASCVDRVTFPMRIGIGGGAQLADARAIPQRARKSLLPGAQKYGFRSRSAIGVKDSTETRLV
jgi:hypothetical protein